MPERDGEMPRNELLGGSASAGGRSRVARTPVLQPSSGTLPNPRAGPDTYESAGAGGYLTMMPQTKVTLEVPPFFIPHPRMLISLPLPAGKPDGTTSLI